ncbi:MAG: acetyltransferase [Herbinix sp.]|jgi:ribosomal protein S18 acetylase RimI-like enzyme|nr:acetyltransferase [Herbinix sp.]
MSTIQQNHSIQVLDYITQAEYNQVNQLMELCCKQDNINLKLELDYKLHLSSLAANNNDKRTDHKREFLYYVEDKLVSYLGISCFDGATGELCGMTHPLYRKQGIFHRLLALAHNECLHSDFKSLLLLADGNSTSGTSFLKSNSSSYAHSEYRMKRLSGSSIQRDKDTNPSSDKVALRLARIEDEYEIARQNAILFNERELVEETEEYKITPLAEQPENYKTYMIELDGIRIGKINVEYSEQYAFICGFGILPEYRGKGYGRMGLAETLCLIEAQGATVIELDVVCTNNNALGLYQSCGFVEQSVMNYYNL